MRERPRLIAALLQVGTVALGWLYGIVVHYPGTPPNLYTGLAVIAGLIMAFGLAESLLRSSVEKTKHVSKVAGGCIVYSAFVVLSEPFEWVRDVGSIIVAVIAFAPLLLAVAYLVRRHAWVSAAGTSLFIFTCSAMFSSNVHVSDAGSGFIGYWI
jgi:hypothetical protein